MAISSQGGRAFVRVAEFVGDSHRIGENIFRLRFSPRRGERGGNTLQSGNAPNHGIDFVGDSHRVVESPRCGERDGGGANGGGALVRVVDFVGGAQGGIESPRIGERGGDFAQNIVAPFRFGFVGGLQSEGE